MPSPELRPIPAPRVPVRLGTLPENPHVSIVVPSFKQGRFIRDTIDSILSQSYRPLTIHVIDGASPDETVEVLKSYGQIEELQWVSEPDRGVVHAVNKGFACVSGDVIAIQSSDDMYVDGTIDRIVDTFREQPDCGLIYGDSVKSDADGREIQRIRTAEYSLENLLLLRTWIPQPSAFFRREMLNACGGWNESIPYAPDTDLWLRMAFRTQIFKIDDFLSIRRMHDEQRDRHGLRIIRDYSRMIIESTDIAEAPEQIQQAARLSCHLINLRYNPSHWGKAIHKWKIRQMRPDLASWSSVLASAFQPARNIASKIKQTILPRRQVESTPITESRRSFHSS